ncbi:hypothetical protein I316_03167 [Kwoniella heveanensis BCC8398]|uniref:Ubiquitin-like domain-containing protein n=1 Tax=Kwoniella heveanensis BCC8398 TaxID=1296120 RepID=A0A1B9GVT0_9TREE|nr:hypothetical protein I316_03167 [Kwoniella heveanensis BCC8398]
MPGPNASENEPLLPTSTLNPIQSSLSISAPTSASASSSTPSRSRLSTRRYTHLSSSPITTKDKGKGRAFPSDNDNDDTVDLEAGPDPSSSLATGSPDSGDPGTDSQKGNSNRGHGKKSKEERGRHVTIIFSNESENTGGNLEIWVEGGESVGSVKDQIRTLRPALQPLNLRLIHSGRLLTDGILLLPWLRSLEERVKRQAAGVGGEVEKVLKDVGLAEDDSDDDDGDADGNNNRSKKEKERVWLHCIVGGKEQKAPTTDEAEPSAPRRRGFDVLLDAGLSADDVAQMRRQFYESRGEEVPDHMDSGDVNDEHARALEEQWIEGDMTAETATTQTEGLYTSILYGLLTGFLFPLIPWFFFRETPLPNFFDSDAEAIAFAISRSESHSEAGAASAERRATFFSSGNPASAAADGGTLISAGASSVTALSTTTPTPQTAQPSGTIGVRMASNFGVSVVVGGGDGDNAGIVNGNGGVDTVTAQVYGKRMQMGILLGTLLNVGFGALRLLN